MEGLTSPVRRSVFLAPLTEEELNAVTVVFHQYETGLREGCIFTKVDTHIIVGEWRGFISGMVLLTLGFIFWTFYPSIRPLAV